MNTSAAEAASAPRAPSGTHHPVRFSAPVTLRPQPQELAGPEGPGTAFGQTNGSRGTNSPAPHPPLLEGTTLRHALTLSQTYPVGPSPNRPQHPPAF